MLCSGEARSVLMQSVVPVKRPALWKCRPQCPLPGAGLLPGSRFERLRRGVSKAEPTSIQTVAPESTAASEQAASDAHVAPAVQAVKKAQMSAAKLAELMRRGKNKAGIAAGGPPPGVWMPGPPPAKPPGLAPPAPPPIAEPTPPQPTPTPAAAKADAAPQSVDKDVQPGRTAPPAAKPIAQAVSTQPAPKPVVAAAPKAGTPAPAPKAAPGFKPAAAAPRPGIAPKLAKAAPSVAPRAAAPSTAPRAAAPVGAPKTVTTRVAPAPRPAAPKPVASDAAPRTAAPGAPKPANPAAPAAASRAAAPRPAAAPSAPKQAAAVMPKQAKAAPPPSATQAAAMATGPETGTRPQPAARKPMPKPVEAPSGPPKVDKAAMRAKAQATVDSHDPNLTATDRHNWLFYTVPQPPVAGAHVAVYFNRAQSEVLRSRPRILAQVGFNQWELIPDSTKTVEVYPSAVRKDLGSDFWCCKFKVPEEVYEINMVFTDGEGLYDNNYGKDFTFQVEGGITFEEWIALAEQRAAALAAERAAAEEEAARKAEEARLQALKEQDKQKARQRVEELRNRFSGWQSGGVSSFKVGEGANTQLLWFTFPQNLQQGTTARLLYNNSVGPLSRFSPIPEGSHLTLNYGFNDWQNKEVVNMVKAKDVPENAGDDWLEAEIKVPKDAACINFVVNYYEHWDNNNRQDYKISVALAGGKDVTSWAESFYEEYRKEEETTRLAKEKIEKEKAVKRAIARKAAMEQVLAVQRRQVRHVLFTDPEVVQAGKETAVYYNPTDTPLNGAGEVYITGGWNRWSHKLPFGPLKMTPPSPGGMHFQATVRVPLDAYKMDFVFSNVPGGEGTYDNRGGLDYHLPVSGSVGQEAKMHIMHIAVEMAPIAKVGGLGDVVTALGRAVKEQGHLVEVILPKYQFLNGSPLLQNLVFETEFDWGGTRIYVTSGIVENLRVFFIEPRNSFFNTPTVYGRYDDEVRFDFFCKAALEFMLQTQRQPDIIHCHDWSTAHVAKAYWEDYHNYGLWKPKVFFTIHNLEYGQKKIAEAAYYCQKFTTVSPTYAFEVGGHAAIAPNAHKFMGVRNGVDPDLWTPEENQFLPMTFNSENILEGKRAARIALRQRLNLTDWKDRIIVAVVSRLTPQKGMHLIKHACFRTLERGGQFVLLGSAPDPKVQADFDNFASQTKNDCCSFNFKYDEPLSHLIYAAADIMLVPSMFEPCGLTQMIAMNYGTVPVVRHTGGLRDTVFDVDFDKARAAWELLGSSDWQRDGLDATNGFAFSGTDPDALDYALNRAIDAWYNDNAWFRSLQKRVMEQDWSWNRPALDYVEAYFSCQKS